MKTLKLDYGGEPTNEEDFFSEVNYFEDYSFDKRGVLQIEVLTEETISRHSFCIPRIHDFVIKNSSYDIGIGYIEIDKKEIESFADFDINNKKQVLLLLSISESLDNFYIRKN